MRPKRESKVIRTQLGAVRGTVHDGFERYLSIPYAEAPAGPGRFRQARPVTGWSGEHDGTQFGPVAPQQNDAGAPENWADDCLRLDIYTPAADGERRPVMVWFHGGAYLYGSTRPYQGTSFCRRGNLVVVCVTYRLGAFGFLRLDDVDAGFAGSGNNGIRDQIEALRWVREHIDAFGGDPDRVTLAGESAGAGSVLCLLAAPAADGLYRRAIAQSAPAAFDQPQGADELLARLLEAMGSGTRVDDLLHASTRRILAAQASLRGIGDAAAAQFMLGSFEARGIGFHPTIDGVVVTRDAATALSSKAGSTFSLLTGTTRDEGTAFAAEITIDPSDDVLIDGLRKAGVSHGEVIVRAHRGAATPGRPLILDVFGEALFRAPTLRAVDRFLRAGGTAWVYLFAWPTPVRGGSLGATHALDLPFTWNGAHLEAGRALVGDAPPTGLALAVHEAVIAFCQSGNPNHTGLPDWPRYDLGERPTLVFDASSHVELDPVRAIREAWQAGESTDSQ